MIMSCCPATLDVLREACMHRAMGMGTTPAWPASSDMVMESTGFFHFIDWVHNYTACNAHSVVCVQKKSLGPHSIPLLESGILSSSFILSHGVTVERVLVQAALSPIDLRSSVVSAVHFSLTCSHHAILCATQQLAHIGLATTEVPRAQSPSFDSFEHDMISSVVFFLSISPPCFYHHLTGFHTLASSTLFPRC